MRKRLLYSVVISILFCLLSTVAVFADAIPEGYYRIKNVLSGLYLDCDGFIKDSNIRQMDYPASTAPQRFLVLKSSDGYNTVHPECAQEMVMDVDGGSSEDNANIKLYPYNTTNAQKWNFYSNGNGSFRIMSKCSQDKKGVVVWVASLNSGANVIQHEYNASRNDMWIMEADLDDALYYIRNKKTGLYLTVTPRSVSDAEVKLAGAGQGKNQQFKVSKDYRGYFDIAPASNTDLSLEVRSSANNTQVTCSYGSGSEGQSWKFILNEDNTYRLVSDITNDQRAVTVLGSTTGSLYSCDYSTSANNQWELIKAESDKYKIEGDYVKLYIDKDIILNKYITSENLAVWIKHLDDAYIKYKELVGTAPANGEKLKIISCSINVDDPMYTYSNQNYIFWRCDDIHIALQRINRGDWFFGMLHEMSHTFDVDSRWKFNGEYMANFKMAYVLKQYDGNFKLIFPDYYGFGKEKILTRYSDVLQYYGTDADNAYSKKMASNLPNMEFHHDAAVYMLLEQIENKSSWQYVKSAFRSIWTSSKTANTNIERYNLFLNTINEQSGNKFLTNYKNAYSRQHEFVLKNL